MQQCSYFEITRKLSQKTPGKKRKCMPCKCLNVSVCTTVNILSQLGQYKAMPRSKKLQIHAFLFALLLSFHAFAKFSSSTVLSTTWSCIVSQLFLIQSMKYVRLNRILLGKKYVLSIESKCSQKHYCIRLLNLSSV